MKFNLGFSTNGGLASLAETGFYDGVMVTVKNANVSGQITPDCSLTKQVSFNLSE